ncbi:TcpE family conjugal transfer membrane protein [Clostridium akagii]|uniref:TcpE family conjugal transfer membrane protein n=1 Tax=Clostridium akagii TaxID=91623 RepID=UPI00047E9433|nr:TcpE family conjugal transfer membrane protein [Clostridium akagii]
MQDRIILRSYNKMNNIEKKIYTIQNFKLPIPVNLYASIYFFIFVLLMLLIGRILPFLSIIPPILKYVLVPYIISKYMRQKKLDGKKPWKYAIDYTIYRFTKNNVYERFKQGKIPKEIRFANSNFRES